MLLERHLVSSFAGNGGDSKPEAECVAKELIRREGGVDGLAKLGIDSTSSDDELDDAVGQMIQDRLLSSDTEPFDRFVDAAFACGLDKGIRSDFLAQLQKDGNSPTASKCLADRVLGDRYLRLVLVIGTKPGATEDPRVETKFDDPLIAAVDRAAYDCGVVSWGGG